MVAEVVHQPNLFSYEALDMETRIEVKRKTDEIRTLMKRTAQDIIDIGQRLIDVKEALPHGEFGKWLQFEFEWTQQTAKRFMNVAVAFQNQQIVDFQIAPSALYLLAAPSTPESVREEAIARAEAGEKITNAVATEMVSEHKNGASQSVSSAPRPESSNSVSSLPSNKYTQTTEETNSAANTDEPEDEEQQDEDEEDEDDTPTTPLPPVTEIPISQQADYDGDSWYTPSEVIETVRSFYGGCIDLDPASSHEAQQTVQAKTFFTKEDDGLDQVWFGRVWMNPPYSFPLVKDFTNYADMQYQDGTCEEVLILVNNCTDAAWFINLASKYPVIFTNGRLSFWKPGNVKFGTRQGQALFYLGKRIEEFYTAFESIGYAPNRLR